MLINPCAASRARLGWPDTWKHRCWELKPLEPAERFIRIDLLYVLNSGFSLMLIWSGRLKHTHPQPAHSYTHSHHPQILIRSTLSLLTQLVIILSALFHQMFQIPKICMTKSKKVKLVLEEWIAYFHLYRTKEINRLVLFIVVFSFSVFKLSNKRLSDYLNTLFLLQNV